MSNFLAARVGVTDLFLAMRLRVALKPLLDRPPIVGALKANICIIHDNVMRKNVLSNL